MGKYIDELSRDLLGSQQNPLTGGGGRHHPQNIIKRVKVRSQMVTTKYGTQVWRHLKRWALSADIHMLNALGQNYFETPAAIGIEFCYETYLT